MRALAEEQIYDGTDELIRSDPDQLARWRPGPGARFGSRVGSRWFLAGAGSVCERSAVKRSIIGAETAPNSRWAPAAQRSTFAFLQLIARSRVMVVGQQCCVVALPGKPTADAATATYDDHIQGRVEP